MDPYNPNAFPVSSIEAESTWNQAGKEVPRGRKTTRLLLGKDARLNIAVREITSRSLASWFKEQISTQLGHEIKFKNGEQELLLNMSSLTNRLHLHPADIYQATERGELALLLQKAAENTQPMISGYQNIGSAKHVMLFENYNHK